MRPSYLNLVIIYLLCLKTFSCRFIYIFFFIWLFDFTTPPPHAASVGTFAINGVWFNSFLLLLFPIFISSNFFLYICFAYFWCWDIYFFFSVYTLINFFFSFIIRRFFFSSLVNVDSFQIINATHLPLPVSLSLPSCPIN